MFSEVVDVVVAGHSMGKNSVFDIDGGLFG